MPENVPAVNLTCHLTLCHCTPEEVQECIANVLRTELESDDVDVLASKIMLRLSQHLNFIIPVSEIQDEP